MRPSWPPFIWSRTGEPAAHKPRRGDGSDHEPMHRYCGMWLHAGSMQLHAKSGYRRQHTAGHGGPTGIRAARRRGENLAGSGLSHALCELNLPAAGDFSVTFSLAGYQPETVAVRIQPPVDRVDDEVGGVPIAILDPNPVYAELQRGGPARRATPAKRPQTCRKTCPGTFSRTRWGAVAAGQIIDAKPQIRARTRARQASRSQIGGQKSYILRIGAPARGRKKKYLMENVVHSLARDGHGDRASAADDRSVRPRDQLFARFGDRPLRFPLCVLHGGKHDFSAKGRSAQPGGA